MSKGAPVLTRISPSATGPDSTARRTGTAGYFNAHDSISPASTSNARGSVTKWVAKVVSS
jgi:hypothetical protein